MQRCLVKIPHDQLERLLYNGENSSKLLQFLSIPHPLAALKSCVSLWTENMIECLRETDKLLEKQVRVEFHYHC